MRLLIVSHSNTPWTPLYARWLVAAGHAVQVVSMSPDPIAGVPLRFIGVEPFDKRRNKHLFVTRVPAVRRIIRESAPDLVFATYVISNGLLAALAWRGPLAVSAQGGDVRPLHRPGDWRNAIRDRIVGYVCRRAAVVHAVSQPLADALVALGTPREKLLVAASGIELNRFSPAPEAPRPVARRIISIRKHEPIYDIPTLVEALARLAARGRDFSAELVGGGYLLEAHRELVERRGLSERVQVVGAVPHESLAERLRAGDVYVTTARADGTSASLLEGMASGLFPVATRIPANTAWLEEGRTGLLFEPSDPGALAAALERALDDAELRRAAFDENRRRVMRDGDLNRNMRALEARFAAAIAERGR
ncbi:MAG: glycosyltransferase [Phycisphaerae bacterium]